jgi:hypothetical protein
MCASWLTFADQLDIGVTHTIARIERVIVQLPERVIERDDTSRKK